MMMTMVFLLMMIMVMGFMALLSAGFQQYQLHPECISAAAASPADLPHPEPALSAHHRTSSTDTPLTHRHTHYLLTRLS